METVLKPQHFKPPPEGERFDYIVDLSTRGHRSALSFCATYGCPGPNAIFETKFTRLEYAGGDRFNLA